MILAFDTYYFENQAKTVCIQFNNWNSKETTKVYEETLTGISDYIPGEFYKRELPCILSLLKKINLDNCYAIIIDGFVFLDDNKKLGLGGHLYKSLKNNIPVIGVAKNDFKNINTHKTSIVRGNSKKALHITAIGMDVNIAAKKIKEMHGEFRFPDLLKKVDSLGRENLTN
ncbi:endonuclease V [Tenacibaculum halocynthiae]|uniref:endonuclease V n=1 Tax=Tenacibaculum halocynthiae TaxID=1254437 RepID=UPI003894F60F